MFRGAVQIAVLLCLVVPAPAQAAARAVIGDRPAVETAETSAKFTFGASSGNVVFPSYECRRDSGPWQQCFSPHRLTGLAGGAHRFEVRLLGVFADITPAAFDWTVTVPTAPLPCVTTGVDCANAVAGAGGIPVKERPTRMTKRRDADRCAYGANRSTEASLSRLTTATVCLINRERSRAGLRAVKSNPQLAAAARSHARDMVARRYFAHVSPAGERVRVRAARSGYLRARGSWALGEILAWSALPPATPELMVRAWMQSGRHRGVLLSPNFRDVGVGVAAGGPGRPQPSGTGTYVGVFGRRA